MKFEKDQKKESPMKFRVVSAHSVACDTRFELPTGKNRDDIKKIFTKHLMIHIKFKDGTEFETKVDYQNGHWGDDTIFGWGGPNDWGPKGMPKRSGGPKRKRRVGAPPDWDTIGWPDDANPPANARRKSRGRKR